MNWTEQFGKEFELFLLIIEFAITEFNLNKNLKLSVHSGSDKFSIYPAIKKHLKNPKIIKTEIKE